MQISNTKTTNQNRKDNFQNRVYQYTLSSLQFISKVEEDKITKVILNQLIRSLTSIGANIVEARASNSKKDFARYFDISFRSQLQFSDRYSRFQFSVCRGSCQMQIVLLITIFREALLSEPYKKL